MEDRTRLAGRPFRFFDGGEECLLRGAGYPHGTAPGQRMVRGPGPAGPGRPGAAPGSTGGSAWLVHEPLAAVRKA